VSIAACAITIVPLAATCVIDLSGSRGGPKQDAGRESQSCAMRPYAVSGTRRGQKPICSFKDSRGPVATARERGGTGTGILVLTHRPRFVLMVPLPVLDHRLGEAIRILASRGRLAA
jgi:hypothetical protein